MEYHADAHEARLAEAAVFESTTRQLARLDVAQQGALGEIGQFLDTGKIPDDLALLVAARLQSMPRKLAASLDEHVETTKTGWLDTHPAPQARIRHARRQGQESVFASDRPAEELFTDFRALSRGGTANLYGAFFGSRFPPSAMCPTAQLLQDNRQLAERPREIEI